MLPTHVTYAPYEFWEQDSYTNLDITRSDLTNRSVSNQTSTSVSKKKNETNGALNDAVKSALEKSITQYMRTHGYSWAKLCELDAKQILDDVCRQDPHLKNVIGAFQPAYDWKPNLKTLKTLTTICWDEGKFDFLEPDLPILLKGTPLKKLHSVRLSRRTLCICRLGSFMSDLDVNIRNLFFCQMRP